MIDKELEYINRIDEMVRLQEEVQKNDIVFLVACHGGYGISRFFDEFACKTKESFCLGTYTLKLSPERSFSSALLAKTVADTNLCEQLQKKTNKIYGRRTGSILSAIVSAVPWLGGTLSQLINLSEATAPPVYLGNYENVLSEFLVPLFKENASKNPSLQALFLVDSAQFIRDDDYNLIHNIAAIHNMKIVLAFSGDNYHSTIISRFSGKLDIAIDTMIFGSPEIKMIQDIGTALSIVLNHEQAYQLISETKANLHRIIQLIRTGSVKNSLTPIENAIIHLLHICSCGIDITLMCSFLEKSNVFSANFQSEIRNAIDMLAQSELVRQENISGKETRYYLDTLSHPLVNKCIGQFTDVLYYENLVLDFFRANLNSPYLCCEMVEILFRLAQRNMPTLVQGYAHRLIELKLRSGDAISEELIGAANFDMRKTSDLRLATLYYCRDRNFVESLRYFLKYSTRKSDLNILKPYLLNYVRDLEASEQEFSAIMKDSYPENKLCILTACRIANAIHLRGEEYTFTAFRNICQELMGYENHGYVARNLASAAPLEGKEYLYLDAIENFSEYRDDFGLFSTMCNRGSFLCIGGQQSQALPHLLESANGMRQFGQTHLHIVYNNIGMCYITLNNTSEAYKYLSLAEKVAKTYMPLLTAQTNLACALVFMGQKTKAWQLMESIRDKVDNHRVLNLKKKYYCNALLCSYACGLDTLRDFMQSANDETRQYVPADMLDAYNKILLYNENPTNNKLASLYYPAALAYWYVDPLKLIL